MLKSFLTEPNFEEWRKHTVISYEEESASKRIDRIEEMAIPSDLEDKLKCVPTTCQSNCDNTSLQRGTRKSRVSH